MRILITTMHPGPYIDKWIEVLRAEHEVDAMYVQKVNSDKVWKNYTVKEAFYYSDYSFVQKVKLFKSYDFVLFGGWFTKINIIYANILKLSATKTAFFSDYPEEKEQNFMMKIFKKCIIKSCDFLFAASNSAKDFYSENYGLAKNSIKIFPYAHNYDFLPITNISEGKIKIFIANRFIARKGYEVVLKCFKILKSKNVLDNFDITIVGGGEEYEFYRNEFLLLSTEINVMKWIENDEYINYLINTNIYLHASIFEPFGIPPLDAMQLGKIVIAADGVKSVNLLKGRSSGLLIYDSNDYNELSDILEKISLDKNLLLNGINNLDVINETYNPKVLLHAFDLQS